MFEKIFGKRHSIQRKLTLLFTMGVLLVISVTAVGYHFLIDNQLIEFNEIQELNNTIKESIVFIIISIILVNIINVNIICKKMLQPIKQIIEATKKVAFGDFSVKLESNRNDEIQDLVDNFNKMVKDLRSIEYLQKEFIDNASHEIKTPISSIQGFAELLKEANISREERLEYANIIIEESNWLLNLATNILKLSKLQNQDRIVKKEQIDIAEQIRKVILLLEPKWSKKKIILNVSLEEMYFVGDEELIFQVWLNLIDNAIKYSNSNGKIDIELKQVNNYLEIYVKDYGKGMKEEELSRIFSRFYQVDKSHSSEGSGLGWAIVKRIIDLSEGTIDVSSKENKGTTFVVKLPMNVESNKILIK